MNIRNMFPLASPPVWQFVEMGAKQEWLKLKQVADNDFTWSIEPRPPMPSANELMSIFWGAQVKGAVWMYSLSRVLAEGPKVFRPTAEQCFSLEHVNIEIPIKDYRQAYPTMLIEYPDEYRKSVDDRTGGLPKCPKFLIVRHWPEGAIMTGCSVIDHNGRASELTYIVGVNNINDSIESGLGIPDGTEYSTKAEHALLDATTRVALNLMMLLATTSSKLQPSNPVYFAKCQEKLKQKIRPEIQKREIETHVHYVVPERDIIVRTTRYASQETGGSHASPHSHWRRGHWRAAPGFGEAKGKGEKVPLVFVRPCFIIGAGGDVAAPVYMP